EDETALHDSCSRLATMLESAVARGVRLSRNTNSQEPEVVLSIANRLFGQEGYAFREPFLELTRTAYRAELQPENFIKEAEDARVRINEWVADQTRSKIRDLLPPNS